ncbi:MAG: ATP-binding cassette domain-containing protein, partial [Streptococcus gallolyticus]|nr:ATP-binding cassette domain-containing protein [Streptococcus gallolyticus]
MIKMKSIEKAYGDKIVLDNVNLEIKPGKFTAFIGPNGAGKSTLLSIMSRLSKKDKGVLMIKDKEI